MAFLVCISTIAVIICSCRKFKNARAQNKIGNNISIAKSEGWINPAIKYAWPLFLGASDDSEAQAYFAENRTQFLNMSAGKSNEEKRALLSKIDFKRVSGDLLIGKQSNSEKDLAIRILEFKLPMASVQKSYLAEIFGNDEPQLWMLKPKCFVTKFDKYIEDNHRYETKGFLISGRAIPVAEILNDTFELSTLNELLEKKSMPVFKRKAAAVKAFVENGIGYEDIEAKIEGVPFKCTRPNKLVVDSLQSEWNACLEYAEVIYRLRSRRNTAA